MTPETALDLGLGILGFVGFVTALWLWDPATAMLRRIWADYARWAEEGMRALHKPLGPADVLKRHLGVVALGVFFGAQLGTVGKAIFFGAVAAAAPWVWMRQAVKKQRKALEGQLDAALQTIANNMLATRNVIDGFAAVAAHLPPPVCHEAELVVRDVKIGSRTDEALVNFGERCRSQHVDAVVTALCIGLRTGGDMAKVLKKIAAVVRETIRCEDLMAAKTSEGKTSAWIIGAMPVMFAVAMQQMAPDWMEPLWTTTIGSVIVAGAALLDLIGILLVLKVSKIDP